MTISEILQLTPPERMAGYLLRSARLAALGAQLRRNGRKDADWSEAENQEWDAIVDELDNWCYALSTEEKALLKTTVLILSCLTRGEIPEPQNLPDRKPRQ